MNRARWIPTAALLFVVSAPGCSSATTPSQSLPPMLGAAPRTTERAVSAADVHFMTGMIPHHAQAVKMALWVPARSARNDVKLMAERMLVSQLDEIALMRMWLADRGQPVPAPDATHMRMEHGGTVHDMLMPGMLRDDELAQLERASGLEFDRLFLTFMILHHQGALAMVNDLFATPGAAQDDLVYEFATDVRADQHMEIRRMQDILDSLPSGRSPCESRHDPAIEPSVSGTEHP
jgi:uncharacterized protein (DUF305 family)